MGKGVNTEHKIKRMIFNREEIGGADFKRNSTVYSRLSGVLFSKVDHHRRKINPFKSNLRNGFRYKDGENSRACSDINGPPPLNPFRQHPFENPLARDPHILFSHEVVIFCQLLVFYDSSF